MFVDKAHASHLAVRCSKKIAATAHISRGGWVALRQSVTLFGCRPKSGYRACCLPGRRTFICYGRPSPHHDPVEDAR